MYYVYCYLREDGSPYYIGKGKGNRAWIKGKGEVHPPTDLSRVKILHDDLSEHEAFSLEKALITEHGRKDIGTGILHNKTDGGEGPSGAKRSVLTKDRIRKSMSGRKFTETHKKKLALSHSKKKLSKEHKHKIKEANLIRFSKIEERIKLSKKGSTNPNASVWKITNPDGEEVVVIGLTSWCRENNIPRDRVRFSQCGWKSENLGKKKNLEKDLNVFIHK